MAGKCPRCGAVLEGYPCDSCGFFIFGTMTLQGSCGTMTVRIDTEIGSRSVRKLLPETESVFYDSLQFTLKKSASLQSWAIVHNALGRNHTAVNGTVCPDGREEKLSDGDQIAIASKTDPTKTAGFLQVSIDRSGCDG